MEKLIYTLNNYNNTMENPEENNLLLIALSGDTEKYFEYRDILELKRLIEVQR